MKTPQRVLVEIVLWVLGIAIVAGTVSWAVHDYIDARKAREDLKEAQGAFKDRKDTSVQLSRSYDGLTNEERFESANRDRSLKLHEDALRKVLDGYPDPGSPIYARIPRELFEADRQAREADRLAPGEGSREGITE